MGGKSGVSLWVCLLDFQVVEIIVGYQIGIQKRGLDKRYKFIVTTVNIVVTI